MENFKAKKAKIIDDLEIERSTLERDIINKNIARRDAFRKAKQKWEDDGFSGPYNPNYKPAIQGYVDAAKLDHEEVKIKQKLKKVVEKVKEVIVGTPEEIITEIIEEEAALIYEEPTIEKVLEGKSEIADKMRDIADDLNGESLKIAYICQKGWNDEFENLFPKKGIWQGQITQSFADWLKETKNYE